VQTLVHTRPFDLFGLWSPDADTDGAYALLREDLAGLDLREDPHPASGVPVLRLRTPMIPGTRP